jgi:hypothetical protein
MSGTTMDQIRITLAKLEEYELPEPFRESPRSSTAFVDTSLLERYSALRDHYLQKTIDLSVANRVATFDGEAFEYPELPIPVEEMEDRHERLQTDLQQTTRSMQVNLEQLHVDYARLQERKEDLRKMLEESEVDAQSLNLDPQVEEEEDVDEEDVEAEQNRLLALQQRKKDLLSKLHRLQEETRREELETTETEASLGGIPHDNETLAQIEKDSEALRTKIESNKEIASYFEMMRLVAEEINGVRIISVMDGNSDGIDVVLLLEVLHSHQVEIGLQADELKKEGLRVASAKLLTPPSVKAVVDAHRTETIELPIPVLDDLVELAQPHPRSKALTFVIKETVARIEMIHERADELCNLVAEKTVRIQKAFSTSNSYGRCDHEVVCSLPDHDVQVLMRMTPDCPRIPGSVYVNQIVGANGEESKDLQDLLLSSRKGLHKRPIDLLRDLQRGLDARK